MPGYINYNGSILPSGSNFISPSNRSFRYGEGFYTSIRVCKDSIPLWDLHAIRLLEGIKTLGFRQPTFFSTGALHNQVLKLCKKNHLHHARIRITIFQGSGGLFDASDEMLEYIIESWPVPNKTPIWNENGLQIGLYNDGIKSVDAFSSLQSNNSLLPTMAAKYAKLNYWNDALLFNHFGRIAETVMANVFWIQSGQIYTNPLTEGPVNGVLREFLLTSLTISEKPLTIPLLAEIDEMFLASPVQGIQWVASCNNNSYTSKQSESIYKAIIAPLFS